MYQRIKGFRDFYPEEMAPRRAVIDVLEETARRYGFREIGTPALELTELYIDKSGPEIVDELYRFTDHGGRDISMTPELTPTVARMVVARQQAVSKPIKWYSTRPFWRYEEPQQGRYREFYQTNVDIFGSADPTADAEILAWAGDSLLSLGLAPADFEFRISHRDILAGLLVSVDESVSLPAAIRAVDRSHKASWNEYLESLESAGLPEAAAVEFAEFLDADPTLADVIDFAGTDRVDEAVTELRNVLAAAADFGVGELCDISLDTARGLDYYTGVVFECYDATGTIGRSIFGGGRYDDLIEGFGGQPMPAVGVAPGHATLGLLLNRAGVLPPGAVSTDYFVLSVGDTRSIASKIANDLRDRGHIVEMDVAGRSFGNQLSYADAIGTETVVIVGERDLSAGVITLKDMATGDQIEVPIDGFPGAHTRPTIADFT